MKICSLTTCKLDNFSSISRSMTNTIGRSRSMTNTIGRTYEVAYETELSGTPTAVFTEIQLIDHSGVRHYHPYLK